MEIFNVRIQQVEFGLDDCGRLRVSMNFYGSYSTYWFFNMENSASMKRLKKLFEFAGVHKFECLNEKIIRAVWHDGYFKAIGDPIEDVFIPLSGKNYTEINCTHDLKILFDQLK